MKSGLIHRHHNSQVNIVICHKNRRRPLRQCQKLFHALISVIHRLASSLDVFFSHLKPMLFHRLQISLLSLRSGVFMIRTDNCNLSVSRTNQSIHCFLRGFFIIDGNTVFPVSIQSPVDQHNGDAGIPRRLQKIRIPLCRYNDDTIHLLIKKKLKIRVLHLRVSGGIADQHTIALFSKLLTDGAQNRPVEDTGNVVHDDTDCLCPVGDQTPCNFIRPVMQAFHRFLDLLPVFREYISSVEIF